MYNMRLVNKIILTITALFFAFMLGCNKHDSTVILVNPENYIKDIDDVTSVLVGDNIVKLTDFYKSNVGIMPDGLLPPNIEGTYVVSPNIRVASTTYIHDTLQVDTIRFYNQNNGIASCDFRGETVDTIYVLGCMNTDKVGEFTTFFRLHYFKDILENYVHYNIERVSGFIITGKVKYSRKTMRATEMYNLHISEIIIQEKKKPEGGSLPYEPGTMYISKDGNILSERID